MNAVTWLVISLAGFTATISAISIAMIIGLVVGQGGLILYRKLNA
ncbi:MAG: hypothetical protein P8179_10905 [Candidatus Thiodiazotropha sp.]|jgi:hypothetical protein